MRRIRSLASASLRAAVLVILYVAVRLTWNVRVFGLRLDPRAPSTYYAITHKRDFDSMAPLSPLLLHRGWAAVCGEVRFAMRSDSFTRGFLARVVRRPAWFVRLLRPVSLRGVVRALGIMPLQKVSVCPLEEWIRDCRDVSGDLPAGQVLAPAMIASLARAGGVDSRQVASTRLSHLFRWKYHQALIRYVGPDALAGDARRATERAVAARARRYLDDIGAWMRQGGSIYSAPEGQFSPDGHLSRITSGFHRVLREAPAGAPVVPIAIVYDFMTTGRPTMFVDVAPAIERVGELSRDSLDDRLRRAWMRAARYTCTQLATGLLVKAQLEARPAFSLAELTSAVMLDARRLHSQGRAVDKRLMRRRSVRRQVRRYLAFCERAGHIHRESRGTWALLPFSLVIDVPPGETGYRTAPLAYAWHELQDMGLPDAATGAMPAGELTA